MKRLIFSMLAAIVATSVGAQGIERLQINEKTGMVTFSQVVECPSKKQGYSFL